MQRGHTRKVTHALAHRCTYTHAHTHPHTQLGRVSDFPLTSERAFLHPQNGFKTSKIVVCNEYTSKVLGQNARIHPLFEL